MQGGIQRQAGGSEVLGVSIADPKPLTDTPKRGLMGFLPLVSPAFRQ